MVPGEDHPDMRTPRYQSFLSLAFLFIIALSLRAQTDLSPATMPTLGTVSPRFLSFNVEMVEVTGGRFWKPYPSSAQGPVTAAATQQDQPPGLPPDLFEYRPPIDLNNSRLRRLAAALAPSYMRVSGTWANSTYFQDKDAPAPQQPPRGFASVLTRAEWRSVVEFSRAVQAKLVTSAAVSAGTRDANGLWMPDQARALLDYTRHLHTQIAAMEFMNEPNFAGIGGAPPHYGPEDYAKDVRLFRAFLRSESPETNFLGPSGTGEGVPLTPGNLSLKMLRTEDLMKATGPVYDAFSYHFYGAVSRRCGAGVPLSQALSAEWLDRTNTAEAFYQQLQQIYLPGKPLWLTETAEAACGGDPIAGQFADTFRFLNQLGALARKGVQVVMHNTLAASDYGLLTENTFTPKPNYWAALLWKRTMGTVVLDPGTSSQGSLRLYAHCLKDRSGGVALLALNTSTSQQQGLRIPVPAKRYTLTAPALDSTEVWLNGAPLHASPDGSLPALDGRPVSAGVLLLPPASITFLTLPSAANQGCR